MASFLFSLPAITLLLILLFSPSSPTVSAELIRDSDGALLRNGDLYYIVPIGLGTGGLTWTQGPDNSPCRLNIKQKRYSLGTLVKVSARDVQTLHIPTGFPYLLALEFVDSEAPCPELGWVLTNVPGTNDVYMFAGNSPSYSFIAEPISGKTEVYKFMYHWYHHGNRFDDVGFDHNQRLTVTQPPMEFRFVKANKYMSQ
ncbi:chymotrypsin inhibitor 3-like [Amaranthus tricolor]|uniref:chymotrypsin inhibitor 3-like n=1 Tax=Amaranthus tricolor TaxID=29722 RepID=UPI00258A0BCF|nr:chymotrypsin inhibitor 3-like [Amaranthus tricolor]